MSSGPCGPCCSVEPTGTMTVSWSAQERLDLRARHLAQEHGRRLHRVLLLALSLRRRSWSARRCPRSSRSRRRRAARWRSGPGGVASRAGVPVAIRSPGRSRVAAEVRDDLRDREAHRRRPAVLDRLAVDRAAEPDVGRVELVGRDDPRPDRAEPGHRLAEQPLVAVEPRVARRDVVDDRVAEDVASLGGVTRRRRPITTPSSHSASTFAVSDAVPARRDVRADRPARRRRPPCQ